MDFEDQVENVLAEAQATMEARQELMAVRDLLRAFNNLLGRYEKNGDFESFKADVIKEVQNAFGHQ